MDFLKYPKIENYRDHHLKEIVDDIVFLEKIHGSNFQFTFVTDKETTITKVGKKSSYMDSKEYNKFYGAGNIVKKYSPLLLTLTKHLYSVFKVDQNEMIIRFFGELYGGHYNKIIDGIRVQRGVDYCSTNEFAVFDIYINDNILSWDEVKQYCDDFNIPRVPEIARGKISEILKTFKLEEQCSKVPKELHSLNDIEKPAFEGVIIRPIKEGLFDRYKWKQKWIIENPPKKPKVPNEDDEMFKYFLGFLNEARFSNFCSKNTPDDILNMKLMGKNIKMLVEDVFESIDIECPDMEKDFRNKLRKPISTCARKMILNYSPPELSQNDKIINLQVTHDKLFKECSLLREKILNLNLKIDNFFNK